MQWDTDGWLNWAPIISMCLTNQEDWTTTLMLCRVVFTSQLFISTGTAGRFNVDCLAIHIDEIIRGTGLPTVSLDVKWAEEQRKGPVLTEVCHLVRGGQKPTKEQRAQCDPEVLKFLNEWPRLIFDQDVLYRKRVNSDGGNNWQLLCPQQLRNMVCKLLHDDMGHLGQDRTIALCQERFYWPGMSTDVVKWISKCTRFTCAKAPSLPHCAPLENIITSQPMEMVALDYLTLEDGRGGVANVLVITDHFSKYAVAIPTTNQTARTTACVLFDAFIVHYGFPTRIHSDQGRNFESRIIKELCAMAGMKGPGRLHIIQWETAVPSASTGP